MRILLSSKHFLPTLGGSVNYAVMLAGAFQRKGAEVIIMTRTPGSEEPVQGCRVVRLPDIKQRFELAAWADLIFQVEASWQDVWPFLLRRIPWFPTIHCGKVRSSSLIRNFAQFGLSVAYHLGKTIPVGDQVAKDWSIRNEPIHNPYDDLVFHEADVETERTIDLLFVGRLEASKGVFVLLEALKRIGPKLNAVPNCCFVGDGADDMLLRKATADFGPTVKFQHLGRLAPEAVAERMRASKILVFPTTPDWIEASPLTPLEALACGCLIIAADSGGTRENIGPDGILVASGDVASLATAILQLLTEPSTRDMNAVHRFLADRTLDQVAAKYLERFSAVIC
jgi:glycogen synthase